MPDQPVASTSYQASGIQVLETVIIRPPIQTTPAMPNALNAYNKSMWLKKALWISQNARKSFRFYFE